MVDVVLEGISAEQEEGTIESWFFEEGDSVNEGDELVQISTQEGTIVIQAPATGVLAEVYYDEGDAVPKGEVLCSIDDKESAFGNDEE